ncbi:MAG: signal peptidase I [Haloferacaceae archaeon]
MNSVSRLPRPTAGDLRQLAPLVVLLLVVSPFAVFAVPQVVGADHSYVVLSGSMEPAIGVGDVVLVERVSPRDVVVGDVITFAVGNGEIPTTHRVVRVVDGEAGLAFQTKGDANEDPDPALVDANNLVGRVALTIPLIGYVIEFVGTTLGFALLVALPIGLLAAMELWDYYRDRQSRVPDAEREHADARDDAPMSTGATGSGSPEYELSDGVLLAVIAVAAAVALAGGYVASQTRAAWAVALTTAAVGSALLTLALREGWFSSGEAASVPTTDGGVSAVEGVDAADPTDAATGYAEPTVVSGRLVTDDSPRIELADADAVYELASANGGTVVVDEAAGLVAHVASGVVYAAPIPDGGVGPDPTGDDSGAASEDRPGGDDRPAGDDRPTGAHDTPGGEGTPDREPNAAGDDTEGDDAA